MGTNFYAVSGACPRCGSEGERLHIGKSSAGWCFSLHVLPGEGINSLEDWERVWKREDVKIVDEYGETLTIDEMRDRILNRSWSGRKWSKADLMANHAEFETHPSGLARHAIGPHCVGHGDGTFDLIPGDFS